MKKTLTLLIAGMAGTLMAQTSTQASPNQSGTSSAQAQSRQRRSDFMVQHLTNQLNLTSDQQTRVRKIFVDSRKNSEAIMPKIREEHEALTSAVKSGNDHEIDRILQQNSQVNADFEANHVKAMAKVYQLLTPEQKTRFDQMDSRWFSRERHGAAKNAGS